MRWLLFVSMLACVACGGEAVEDAGTDGGPRDAALDGASGDAGPSDAGLDAMSEDTAVADDSGLDDAGPHDAGGAASDAGREACNRFDDDADGRVDEGACRLCTSCPPCEIAVRDGVSLLSCERPTGGVTMVAAWQGVCEQLGSGYRLADLHTVDELVWAQAAVEERAIVGLRRFGAREVLRDARGVERDEAGLVFDPTATRFDVDRCFELRTDGLAQVRCNNGQQYPTVLCEGEVLATRAEVCVPAPETCDHTDEDCDGRIDEGGCDPSCVTTRFVDHVYWACSPRRSFADTRAACEAAGGRLASINGDEEALAQFNYYNDFDEGFFWVGLRVEATDGGVEPRWFDGEPVVTRSDGWLRWSDGFPVLTPGLIGTLQVSLGRLATYTEGSNYGICEWPLTVGP